PVRGGAALGIGAHPVAMKTIEDVQNSKRQSSGSRFIGIVAVFVGIGPPVGALAVTLLLAALGLGSGQGAGAWADQGRLVAGAMLLGLVFGIPLSYIVGAVPAAMIGLATAAWDANKGRVPFYVPLGAALVLGVLAAGRLGRLVSSADGERAAQIAVLLAHLAATCLCWLVVRAAFIRPSTSNMTRSGGNNEQQ